MYDIYDMLVGGAVLAALAVAAIALLVLLILLIKKSFVVVPESWAAVVERRGVYRRTWGKGVHFRLVYCDRVRKRVSLKEQVLQMPPALVHSRDGVAAQAEIILFLRVIEPQLYTYGFEKPMTALENLNLAAAVRAFGALDLADWNDGRDAIAGQIAGMMNEYTEPAGMRVTHVEVGAVQLSDAVQAKLEQAANARQEAKAITLHAQAAAEAQVVEAQCQAAAIEKLQTALAKALRQLDGATAWDQPLRRETMDLLFHIIAGKTESRFDSAALLRQAVEQVLTQPAPAAEPEQRETAPAEEAAAEGPAPAELETSGPADPASANAAPEEAPGAPQPEPDAPGGADGASSEVPEEQSPDNPEQAAPEQAPAAPAL